MKKLSAKKKILFVAGAIALVAFAVYNMVWFLNYRAYNKYIGDGYAASSVSPLNITRQSGETTFTVKKPGYLSFAGNLAVVNGDQSARLLIWPSCMCGNIKEYGLAIYDNTKDRGFMVYVTSEMEYDTTKSTGLSSEQEAEAKLLLEVLHDEVLEQLSKAKNEFRI
jgi:hypothetical protein